MNKYLLVLFILIFSAFGEELKINYNFSKAMEEAIQSNKKIVMFMYTDYCPWCKKMKETTFKKDTIIEDLNENYILLFSNKDEMDYPKDLYPEVVPITYILDVENMKNVKVLDGALGFKNEDDFLSLLYKNH